MAASYREKKKVQNFRRKRRKQECITLIIFLSIPLLFLFYFSVYPVLSMLYYSFTDWRGTSGSQHFVGWGNYVHVYPEGILFPYYLKGIRQFQRGAFKYAYDADVPVVPMVITFRERRGLRRITNRKPLITMTVLEPVYPDTSKRARPESERLLFECYEKMADFFDEHSMPVPQEQYPRAGSCESAAPLNQEETTDPASPYRKPDSAAAVQDNLSALELSGESALQGAEAE